MRSLSDSHTTTSARSGHRCTYTTAYAQNVGGGGGAGDETRLHWSAQVNQKSAALCIGVMIYAHEPRPTPAVRPVWLGFMRSGRSRECAGERPRTRPPHAAGPLCNPAVLFPPPPPPRLSSQAHTTECEHDSHIGGDSGGSERALAFSSEISENCCAMARRLWATRDRAIRGTGTGNSPEWWYLSPPVAAQPRNRPQACTRTACVEPDPRVQLKSSPMSPPSLVYPHMPARFAVGGGTGQPRSATVSHFPFPTDHTHTSARVSARIHKHPHIRTQVHIRGKPRQTTTTRPPARTHTHVQTDKQ